MTAQDLARLIASHRWLSQELTAQNAAGQEENCQHIRAELDALFLKIVQFPSDNPYVCCAQIDFLVSAMATPGRDDAVRGLLCKLTLSHLKRLTGHLDNAKRNRTRSAAARPTAQTPTRHHVRTGSA
ncbi:MAG: hypothetical protein R3D44_08660 [Hyphomicrobiaceae bacterium]